MLVQGNVRKEPVSFPVLDGELGSRSDAESDAEQQDVVAISFQPGKENDYEEEEEEGEGDAYDSRSGDSDAGETGLEKLFVKLFDEDETNLGSILKNASNIGDAETHARVADHLQKLKDLSGELYAKTCAVDERTYLCYMTTRTSDLSEIDGVILRHYYLERFVWKSDLLSSLRILCSRLFFKGESQNIDIMIHSFANNWYSRFNQPSFIYGNIIGVYLVTYALILLNTDLHNDAIVSSLRNSSQQSLPVSSVNITRRKSGSLFDIFSHDTSSSILENESDGRKCTITCITKNQFVMNTIAALNDNFVVVNPLIMRKQLRLYYSNVKSHEILLPKFASDVPANREDSHPLAVEHSTAENTLITGEDPNDEVTELRTLASLKPINSIPSVASTRVSFELVSGTAKETVGPFGFLKETEKHETAQGLDTEDIAEPPFVKEGLQKVLVNDFYIAVDGNYERYNSSALLFKEIPDVHTAAPAPAPASLRRRRSFIDRILRREEKKQVETVKKPDFKFAECFVAVCDGELRLFEFDKNPDRVNSYGGHGRGEWTQWAQCLASVSLTGCYAEVIGKSRRQSSQEERRKLAGRFGDAGVYWKLELPYSMMEMVNGGIDASSSGGSGGSGGGSRRRLPGERFEKMLFMAYSETAATEFVDTCNYWAGLQSKVPSVQTQFLDEMQLTSVEYGFSADIVATFARLAALAEGPDCDERRRLVSRLETLLLSERRVAEWRPVVHSCETVADASVAAQTAALAAYLADLSGVLCEERRLLQRVRAVYNGVLLEQCNRPLLAAVRALHANHRAACLAVLRERRRVRAQRRVLAGTVAGGKETAGATAGGA